MNIVKFVTNGSNRHLSTVNVANAVQQELVKVLDGLASQYKLIATAKGGYQVNTADNDLLAAAYVYDILDNDIKTGRTTDENFCFVAESSAAGIIVGAVSDETALPQIALKMGKDLTVVDRFKIVNFA